MFNLLTNSSYTRHFRIFYLQYSNSKYAVTKRRNKDQVLSLHSNACILQETST